MLLDIDMLGLLVKNQILGHLNSNFDYLISIEWVAHDVHVDSPELFLTTLLHKMISLWIYTLLLIWREKL
jgi:hypothetical protein